jgi:hypothetical protein
MKEPVKAAPKAEAKPKDPELTKSANKSISVKEAGEQRAAAIMSNRWATIKETDGVFDKDPRREVISIALMEAGPPEVSTELSGADDKHTERYSYQQVGPGVIIGMREGGAFESVDGFGWKDAADKAAHGNPVGSGATQLRDVGAQ